MKRLIQPSILVLVLIGIGARFFLLMQSLGHQGYFISDTPRYLWITEQIMSGNLRLGAFFYPIGLPLYFLPSWFFGSTLLPMSVLNIFIFGVFTYFASMTIARQSSVFWGIVVALFLSLDTIWLSQTVLLGADFLGAVVFGLFLLLFMQLRSRAASGYEVAGLGLLMAVAAFLKPVYLWVPVFFVPMLCLFQRPFLSRTKLASYALVFSILWTAPLLTYSFINKSQGGKFSFYGHDAGLYGKYIIGYIFVGKKLASDGVQGEKMAIEEFDRVRKTRPETSWAKLTMMQVAENPVIASRLFLFSMFRTIFGNANIDIARMVSTNPMSPPGLWMVFSQGGDLFKKLQSLNWGYILGAFFTILMKCLLILAACFGAWQGWRYNRRSLLEITLLFLLVGYFAATPIVFGEPRYFLPATIILLYLASLIGQSKVVPIRATT